MQTMFQWIYSHLSWEILLIMKSHVEAKGNAEYRKLDWRDIW